MELAQLTVDQAVNIKVLKWKIIIEPIASKRTHLEDLLAGITPDNILAEESFGHPQALINSASGHNANRRVQETHANSCFLSGGMEL